MFQTDHSFSLANAEISHAGFFCVFFQGSYYTTLSFDIVRDVFVLFTFAEVEVIWFDTLVSDQTLALLQVLHII